MTAPGGNDSGVAKHPTGIPGFEFISEGGLPAERATLVAGSSGSGKTLFGAQFLVEGIRDVGEPGVFVTFEESPEAIRANLISLGWPVAEWEEQGDWAFVDLSPDEEVEEVAGAYDLGAILPRVEHGIRRVGARRLVVDSLGTLFSQYADRNAVRSALLRLTRAFERWGVTTVVTAERTEEYGSVARFGVEEFVSDSVVLLRNVLEGDKRRRTMEILKMRGTSHHKGEFPFTIGREAAGVSIIPLSAIELNQPSSSERISVGSAELDALCGDGLYRDSVTLVSGATGTGKTLLGYHFLAAGASAGERSLLLGFEEGREQILRNAHGWGMDFRAQEEDGALRIASLYPETAGLEDHLVRIKGLVDSYRPQRLVVDSLSAMERIGSQRGFKEFVIALIAHLREAGIAVLCTASSPSLMGGESATEAQISSMTDTIVLLRYLEAGGAIQRAIAVLKMRGSDQDKGIRAFTVTDRGIRLGERLAGASGSVLGFPHVHDER